MNPMIVGVGVLLVASPAILLVALIVMIRRFRDSVHAELRRLREDVSRKTGEEPRTDEHGQVIG
ncbi:hypothetical protein [Microbacterium sp. K35]|uniref:hypothetical protein n=1 Tax=Microbacterium sp. K35 TaxID=2305440 RepID=UPI00109BAAF8|nr:hypothetical protein [Microbacterium sp. K35]